MSSFSRYYLYCLLHLSLRNLPVEHFDELKSIIKKIIIYNLMALNPKKYFTHCTKTVLKDKIGLVLRYQRLGNEYEHTSEHHPY